MEIERNSVDGGLLEQWDICGWDDVDDLDDVDQDDDDYGEEVIR